jgi:hypothetical protein
MNKKWRRSSRCDNSSGNCVEVGTEGNTVQVRDSKHPGTVLEFTREEWAAHIEGVKLGEFDN